MKSYPLSSLGAMSGGLFDEVNSGTAYSRDWRRSKFEAGLCTRCGIAPLVPGRKLCHDCLAKCRAYNRKVCRKEHIKDLSASRIEAGICVRCGKNRACNGLQHCSHCREAQKRTYADRISRGICRACSKPAVTPRQHCQDHLDFFAARHTRARLMVFSHYGMKCACCGLDEFELLTIDHINNDGAEHRRLIGAAGQATYKWLIKNGFPNGFQSLCWNCNESKRFGKGICYHKRPNPRPVPDIDADVERPLPMGRRPIAEGGVPSG